MKNINEWPTLKHSDAVLMDVRTDEEWNEGHLNGAIQINISSPEFPVHVEKLDKSKDYYIYCRSGGRSAMAAGHMLRQGFDKVTNLEGGMMAWQGEVEK